MNITPNRPANRHNNSAVLNSPHNDNGTAESDGYTKLRLISIIHEWDFTAFPYSLPNFVNLNLKQLPIIN
jgi:hypothetical protein